MNTRAVTFERYSRPFLKWTREELKQMDQITRQLMTMLKGGRGLAIIECSVDASIQRLKDYIEKRGGRVITATRNNADITRITRSKITRKPKWERKQPYGRFKRMTSEISNGKRGRD